MKRILLLAYHFPPIGGAGTQRNAKLARYLPELGYQLDVVTGPGAADYRWTPIDASMNENVHETVRVHRLPSPEPGRPVGHRGSIQRWLRLTSYWEKWWARETVRVALEMEPRADLVYASLNPFSTVGAAVRVARALERPLVLDLEDPWALDEMLPHETGLHAWLELRTMRRALAAGDAIVMNTPEAAERVRSAFPELVRIPITSVVNGFDAADFEDPPPCRDDGVFRIVHTGSLHHWAARRSFVRRVLGGAHDDVDPLTRSLVPLLDEQPHLRGRIEVHLAGRLTDEDRATYSHSNLVHEHGFLSHPETVRLMQSADVLFLPMHDVPSGRRVGIVPCKTYEYLGAGRPILAAVPDGDARDMLEEAGNAWVCRPGDAETIKSGIVAAMDQSGRGIVRPPSAALLRRIERRQLTRDLASFLESLSSQPRFRSAAVHVV
jgi:glycosyltransferase involved in cell wall biosynthesis